MAHLFDIIKQAVALLIVAAIGLAVAPSLRGYLAGGEAARTAVKAQAVAIDADSAAAGRAQAKCLSEIRSSMAAQAAIVRAARPVAPGGAKEALIGSREIEDAIQ